MSAHPCPLCGESKGYDKSWNSSELFCRACCRRVAINNAVSAKLRQSDDAVWNAAAAHAQGLRERIAELENEAREQALQALASEGQWIEQTGAQQKRIAELERDNANLKTVMVAAAEEIHAHWDAHCDAEGYGPQNLMRRLEEGIPSEYGYTAGAFAAQQKRIAELEAQRVPLPDEQIADAVREADLDWHHGWTLDETEPNRFTQLVRAVERAHGIEPTNQRESA